jgi:hypothetical protein
MVCQSQVVDHVKKKSEKKVHFGFSVGLGLISPDDVNKFIDAYYSSKGFTTWAEGKTWPVYLLEVHLNYFVIKNIELKAEFGGSMAVTKIEDTDMLGMDNDRYNVLYRYYPAIIGNYHLYLRDLKSLYVGGGITFNTLYLSINDREKSNGKSTGYRLNLGYLTRSNKPFFFVELEVNFIDADAEVKEVDSNYQPRTNEIEKLNYSGFNIVFGLKL